MLGAMHAIIFIFVLKTEDNKTFSFCLSKGTIRGAGDQDFQLGGALKIMAPSGAGRENFWGISCEKSRF